MKELLNDLKLNDLRSAGDRTRLGYWRLYRAAKEGHLKVLKIGRKFFVTDSSLQKFLERAEHSAGR